MSSLSTAGRKTSRSRSPNPPLGRDRSSERGGQNSSSSAAAAKTSRPAASVTPIKAPEKPSSASAKPATPTTKPVWRSGGGPATTPTATRGRPPTRGGASRAVDTSRSSTPTRPLGSPPAQTQSIPSERPKFSGLMRSRGTGRRDTHLQSTVEPAPTTPIALASKPQVISNHRLSTLKQVDLPTLPLVANNINNYNYAPGGSIINNNYNETHLFIQDPSSDVLQIIEKGLAKHHVPGALHDAQSSDAGCLEGTRVQLLDDIKSFLTSRGGPHIAWIAGMAGTGKTSIALTLCRTLAKELTIFLGGTFFCSRSAGAIERIDVLHVVPTFAAVLARKIPTYADALAEELKIDPDLAHKSIHVQFEHLLIRPLKCLESLDRQIVFVVDALDECSDEAKLVELIDAMAGFTSPTPVKFLLTSRPEMHIRETSIADTSLSSIVQLHTIEPEHITADIRLYIRTTFNRRTTTSKWYTEDDVDDLVALSGGLFIFAATALAYILGRGHASGRSERLRTVKMQTSTSVIATAQLDKMYSLVLRQAFDPDAFEPTELGEMRRIVAAILSIRAPLTIKALAELIGMSPGKLRGALEGLHAVILVPEDDDKGELRALHASFGDFMFTRAPEHIRICKNLGHENLARACLQRMTCDDLCFNVSRSTTSYKANPKVNLDWIATSLIYACLHWAHHVDLASVRSSFDDMIESVLRRKLLFWLEVLSIIGEVGCASGLLRIVVSAVEAQNTLIFLRDANSFVTSSHEAIERSAAHIYLSALPFAPQNSLIRQNFYASFIGLPSVETLGINHHGGRCVMVLAGHGQAVTGIAYSPDGRTLASSSADGTVRLWDTRSGVEMRKPLTNGDEHIKCIAFTPDGHCVVAGTSASNIHRWDIRTGRLLLPPLSLYATEFDAVAVSPDGKTIASVSDDFTITMWSIENGYPVCDILRRHSTNVCAISFSPDGKTLASGGFDHSIRFWDCRLGQPVGEPLRGHQGTVVSVLFSPDGSLLASSSSDGVVNLWEFRTGVKLHSYSGHLDWVNCVAFAPSGGALASASSDLTVHIWNFSDSRHVTSPLVLRGHSDAVRSVCFSKDGLNVASCSDDRTIRIWDIGGSYASVLPLDGHTGRVNSVAVSSDSRLIVSASNDGSVRVWDAHTREQMLPPLLGHKKSVRAVAISTDNRWIASGSNDKTVRLWDAWTGLPAMPELRGHRGPVNSVAFSPNHLHLASASKDCTVRIWSIGVEQPGEIQWLNCDSAVRSVAYSPDGKFLAVGENFSSADSGPRIFDAATGQQVRSFKRSDALGIDSLSFSPDGALIVVPSNIGIDGFDVGTGDQVFDRQGRIEDVQAVTYSPDGRLIALGAAKGVVCLCDAKTMETIEPVLHSGAESAIVCVVFSSDGRFLVTSSDDTTIRLWDLEKAWGLAPQRERNMLASLALAQYEGYRSGWLVSPAGDLLLWVPPEYRLFLEIAGLCRIIATCRVVVNADDGVLHQGEHWTRCWRTDNSSNL